MGKVEYRSSGRCQEKKYPPVMGGGEGHGRGIFSGRLKNILRFLLADPVARIPSIDATIQYLSINDVFSPGGTGRAFHLHQMVGKNGCQG
jgi:hypothetical protein